MGFFVKQELEVLVGSAGWGEKVGPTPRPGAEALVQTLREGETEKDTENTQRYKNKVDGRGQGQKASRFSALGNWIRVMIRTEMGKTARGVKNILFSRR